MTTSNKKTRRTHRTRTRRITLAAVAALGLVLSPVRAGEKKEKCSGTADTCLRMMSENLAKKGWIGIEMHQKDEEGRPVITRVVPDSPAVGAGFQVGDALTGINGVTEADGEEAAYAEWKRSMVPANKVVVTVVRDGKKVDLPVTLGTVPEAVIAQWIGYHMLEQHLAAVPDSNDEADDDTETESP
ncbi:MAG: PDZ domain-containing protein [Acidobacteriota bacterium]|nr:PDZ domain-containing protein [Acidobacteriota bacterium]